MRRATKVVVALGGNALEDKQLPPTAQSQHQVLQRTARQLSQLSVSGYELAIVHGNGPQVGRILLASETARDVTPPMPFDVCGAMSQGYIGYHIQQTLTAALRAQGKDIPVVTVITQVVVDPADPAFSHPTKPIGAFMTKAEADKLVAERGYDVIEDAGRGYRRVVASPKPVSIVEIDSIRDMVEAGLVVVACGGGGIPVFKTEGHHLKGAAAVIDKDFAACTLAQQLDADCLIILTAVEKVAIHFGKPDVQWLATLTPDQAKKYMDDGEFAPGSMLPKVQAAVQFAQSKQGRTALITLLEKAKDGIEGKTGTLIQQ